MIEVLRSNDPVRLSWVEAVLSDAGIACLRLDEHMSALEGSIGAVPRRLVVALDDFADAKAAIAMAERELEP